LRRAVAELNGAVGSSGEGIQQYIWRHLWLTDSAADR